MDGMELKRYMPMSLELSIGDFFRDFEDSLGIACNFGFECFGPMGNPFLGLEVGELNGQRV